MKTNFLHRVFHHQADDGAEGTEGAISGAAAEAEAKPAVEPEAGAGTEAEGEAGDTAAVREGVIEALRQVFDPEIPVNVYDLGLIYGIEVDDGGRVEIRMTLTAPACPVAGILPGQVEQAARSVAGVSEARVELVWDPPWSPERMTDEARLALGMF